MVRYEITVKVFSSDAEPVTTLAQLTTDSPEVAASTLHAAANRISPTVTVGTQKWPPGVRGGPTTTTNASGIIPS